MENIFRPLQKEKQKKEKHTGKRKLKTMNG